MHSMSTFPAVKEKKETKPEQLLAELKETLLQFGQVYVPYICHKNDGSFETTSYHHILGLSFERQIANYLKSPETMEEAKKEMQEILDDFDNKKEKEKFTKEIQDQQKAMQHYVNYPELGYSTYYKAEIERFEKFLNQRLGMGDEIRPMVQKAAQQIDAYLTSLKMAAPEGSPEKMLELHQAALNKLNASKDKKSDTKIETPLKMKQC